MHWLLSHTLWSSKLEGHQVTTYTIPTICPILYMGTPIYFLYGDVETGYHFQGPVLNRVQYRPKVTWHSRHETRDTRLEHIESRVSSLVSRVWNVFRIFTTRTKRSPSGLSHQFVDSAGARIHLAIHKKQMSVRKARSSRHLQVLPCANFTSDHRENYNLVHFLVVEQPGWIIVTKVAFLPTDQARGLMHDKQRIVFQVLKPPEFAFANAFRGSHISGRHLTSQRGC